MKRVSVTSGTSLDDVLCEIDRDDPVVIMRDGHAVALLTAFDDEDLQWYAREREPAFIASIQAAREQITRGESVRHEDLKRQLGLDKP